MTQINYSTKYIKNKHLAIKERAQIELLVKQVARAYLKTRACSHNEETKE